MTFSFTAPRFPVNDFRKESLAMTDEEKVKATQDLKGITKGIDEKPEFVQTKLEELLRKLEEIENKTAYLEAQRRVPQIVNSFEFRVMFLRATRFDAETAASKLVNYWNYKLSLFGDEVAFRSNGRILISDLDKDDIATLDSLGMFCLPNDKANRGVLFSRRQNWIVSSSKKNVLRLLWYLLEVITDDTNVQKNGIIAIRYNMGEYGMECYDRIVDSNFHDICQAAFPCYLAGTHLCYNSKVFELLLPYVLHIFGQETRSRLRLHDQAHKILDDLEEFGLIKDNLPTIMGGKFIMDANSWKRGREDIENCSQLLWSRTCNK